MLFNGSAIKVIIDVITAGICQRDFNYTREFREMASTELSKLGDRVRSPTDTVKSNSEVFIKKTQNYFRSCQYNEGYWWAELESNVTMASEYLLLSYYLGKSDKNRWRKACNYILSKQREDGSWGQYYQAPGDVSTSVEAYLALKLAGHSPESSQLRKARDFIVSCGGVPNTRVFTKIWLALFGQWDWNGTPNMPPELMLLPSWAPFNIYEFSSWARPTVVPLLLVLTRRPTCQIPKWAWIDELYPKGRAKVDYSLPKPPAKLGWASLFYHLDRLVGLYHRLPVHPLRSLAERRAIRWVLDHQEADGSWAGIQPPWVYSLIALHHLDALSHEPVIEKGFDAFDKFAIEDEETFNLQGCISPVWDTCLAQLALIESGVPLDDPMVTHSTEWLLDQQILTTGDWKVKAKNAQPGGWAFEFHNDLYPDIDDTAVVIMAMQKITLSEGKEALKAEAIERGVSWILAMQNRNGGWAAFDRGNDSRYMTQLPFSDFGETLDPPSADVTGHVLEMLGRLGYSRKNAAIDKAYRYLLREQEQDGPWFGRWGVNFIYGTGSVLPGLAAIGEDMEEAYVQRSITWIEEHQNSDGGWGESCGSYVDMALRGVGPSTASQTSWALLALMAGGKVDSQAVHRGINYLISSQSEDGTWEEPYFTGTGFPGYGLGTMPKKRPSPGELHFQGLEMSGGFMIHYHMYRNCWPLLALGRYQALRCNNSG